MKFVRGRFGIAGLQNGVLKSSRPTLFQISEKLMIGDRR